MLNNIYIHIHTQTPSQHIYTLLYPQTEDLLFPVQHNDQKYDLIIKK